MIQQNIHGHKYENRVIFDSWIAADRVDGLRWCVNCSTNNSAACAPLVKNSFEDSTPYTHYSLLKTISEAWGLPYFAHAADSNNPLIVLPWK
jgi:hypothetical protein